jgi:hypothetical protein
MRMLITSHGLNIADKRLVVVTLQVFIKLRFKDERQ